MFGSKTRGSKFDLVPKNLKRRRIWLLWREIPSPDGKKPKKVPCYVDGSPRKGELDVPADRKRLATFDNALAEYTAKRGGRKAYAGLGIALGKADDGRIMSGIDLDDCLNDKGDLTPVAERILKAAAGSYCEISPSGSGLKIFGFGDLGDNDNTKGVEIYSRKRFFTVTGRLYLSSNRKFRNLKNAAKVARESGKDVLATKGLRGATLPKVTTERIREGGRNQALSIEAYRLQKKGHGYDAILAIVNTYNDSVCDPPLSGKEVEAIVRGKLGIAPDDGTGFSNKAHKLEDFYAHNPTHKYIYLPTNELWPRSTVASVLNKQHVKGFKEPIDATLYLDRIRSVQSSIWCPGKPRIIEDVLPNREGVDWLQREGARCFNYYVPPRKFRGDPKKVRRWLDHVRRLYPNDAEHIFNWLAHRIQKPGEKINHALVLVGAPGIGKDTILEPLRIGVGEANWKEIGPRHVFGRFNPFVKAVVLRISEARDLGESNRYQFYEHMKPLLAAPPDAFMVDEKFVPEYLVANVVGVVITTNHLQGGMYLPSDDRRHYVANSSAKQTDFDEDYFAELWDWYNRRGNANVIAWLGARDLSKFDAKQPPLKTPAFYAMVDSHRPAEEPGLVDAIEKLGKPKVLTLQMLIGVVTNSDLRQRLKSLYEGKRNAFALSSVGYDRFPNPKNKQGLWKVDGQRAVVFVHSDKVPIEERVEVVREFVRSYKSQEEAKESNVVSFASARSAKK